MGGRICECCQLDLDLPTRSACRITCGTSSQHRADGQLLPQVDPPTESYSHPMSVPSYNAPTTADVPEPPELAPISAIGQVMHHTATPLSEQRTIVADGPDKAKAKWETLERPIPQIQYGPRWCRFCRINKPDRTHHCRHCGTCVLQFDHHCIWVGQCVGWANHKVWRMREQAEMTVLHDLLLLGNVILFLHAGHSRCLSRSCRRDRRAGRCYHSSVRPDNGSRLIHRSALFGIFTASMFGSHVYLIITGKSTVESFSGQDQSQHESRYLQAQLGFWTGSRDATKVKKKWKAEWGGSEVDERWRVGGAMTLWRQEMGKQWYGWIREFLDCS